MEKDKVNKEEAITDRKRTQGERPVVMDGTINYEAVTLKLAVLSDTYESELYRRASIKTLIIEKDGAVKLIENFTMGVVSSVYNAETHKPVYSNLDKRNAETARRLGKNKEYSSLFKSLYDLRRILSEYEANLESLQMRCRNYRMILSTRPTPEEEALRKALR